jgi:citrate synthase
MIVNNGLKNVIALESDISRIDGEKGILEYRGYNIHDLAKNSSFEEVAFLLLNGNLPTKSELKKFSEELAAKRALPRKIFDILNSLPTINYPTVILRTIYSYLGCMDDKLFLMNSKENRRKAVDLIAKTPTIIAYNQKLREKKPITPPKPDLGHAANFLWMLNDEEPDRVDEKALDLDLIFHAEHTLNASTFAARIAASTLSDMYAGIVSATGTLFGPLHGGASQKVIEMLRELKEKDTKEIEAWVEKKLRNGEKIMGFGHRVYKKTDPRAEELKKLAKKLDILKNNNWHSLSEELVKIVYRKKRLYPNVDFYAASVYANLGIPDDQFINMFIMGRIVGWTTHIIDQYRHNKIVRPLQQYIGQKERTYIQMDNR